MAGKWAIAQRLELWWWKRYLRQTSPTTYLQWKTDYWNTLLAQLPDVIWPPPSSTIMEVGCGPAGSYIALSDYHIHAVDPLLDRYAQTLPHFDPTQWPNVEFDSRCIEQQLQGHQYPLVLTFNAINHVKDWTVALQQLGRHTLPGGWLVLSSDVHRYRALRQLFRLLPADALHPQQHTAAEYRAVLRSLGFTIHWEKVYKPGKVFDYWIVVAQKNPA